MGWDCSRTYVSTNETEMLFGDWSQQLRYKDYHLASRPAKVERERAVDADDMPSTGFFETESVKDFGGQMRQRGVLAWWRKGMGYASDD